MKNRIISLMAAMVLALSAQAANIGTDRSWYLAGEAMKVNVTMDNVQIAYAELCDANGLAASAVVNLKGGKGACTIELPSTLHSGFYVLSAYTHNDAHVQNKMVAIINPLHKSQDDDITWTKADSCYVTAKGAAELINKKNIDVRETEGQIIKARIKNVYGGKTYKADQIRASLSIIGKQIHYFEGRMMNDSTVTFYTFGIHGKQPLVLSAITTNTDVSLPIEMISPFATLIPKKLPHLVFNYNRSEVEARSLDMQRHQMAIAPAKRELQLGVFTDDATEEAEPLEYDEIVYGTKPDLSYNLDEYRQFLTIKEAMLEYVDCVSKKRVKGTSKLFVRREQAHYNTILPSLVLIDGMPVLDVERLLKYDARRIHYINIYGGQYTFGSTVYNGILSFVSRSGRLTNYPTEPNMQYLVYEF